MRISPAPAGAAAAAGVSPRRQAARADHAAPTLAGGLERWRTRLSRLRLVAVGRRQLLVACALSVVMELILLAAGTARSERALWLVLPLGIALIGSAAALRRRLSTPEVARLLDHDLALAERVGTAVEVGEPPELTGLARLVVVQAGEAVNASLTAARAVFRPARAEWLGLLGAAVAAALLVALPASGSSHRSRHPASPHRTSARAASTRSTRVPGTARPPAAHAPGSTSTRSHRPPPLSFGNAQTPGTPGRELARGPSGGKPSGGAAPKQLAHGGNGEAAPHSGAGAGQSGSSGTAGFRAGGGGKATGKASASAGAGHSGAASASHGGLGKAATGAHAGKTGTPNAAGSAGSSSRSSGAQGAFNGRHTPQGGDTAGHARGSTKGAAHASRPSATAGSSGLPIQSGYTPSSSAHSTGRQGLGPAVSGGSGRARTGGATGSGAAGSGSFPFIAPSPNAPPAGNQSLLLNYFGPFSSLLSGTW